MTLKKLTVKFNSAKLNRRYFSKPTPYAKPTNAKSTQTYQKLAVKIKNPACHRAFFIYCFILKSAVTRAVKSQASNHERYDLTQFHQ